MQALDDVTATLTLALQASGCNRANVLHKPRLLSDNGASYISGDLADWLEDQGMDHVRGAPYPTRCPGFVSGPKTDGNTLAIGIGLERPLDGKLRTNATLFGSPVGHARDLSGSLVDL